jgi:hypothetical protein
MLRIIQTSLRTSGFALWANGDLNNIQIGPIHLAYKYIKCISNKIYFYFFYIFTDITVKNSAVPENIIIPNSILIHKNYNNF